jgi:hypothetical protein
MDESYWKPFEYSVRYKFEFVIGGETYAEPSWSKITIVEPNQPQ